MNFNKFKKIMSYCKQYGEATLDGFGRLEDTLIKEVIEFTKY